MQQSRLRVVTRDVARDWELYLLFLPVLVYYLLFHYVPMYGIQIAFKDFSGALGIWASPWVGFDNFARFINGSSFKLVMLNTLEISLYSLAAGFPAPILLALMLNEMRSGAYKKSIQTVTYAPHFISTVVMCGMIILFLSPSSGFINKLFELCGLRPRQFMYEGVWFKTIYVFSDIWQETGWGSVIYLAALSSIDPQLHEAAKIDGASILGRIWHINIPGILPTISIMLILRCGAIMDVGFEKVFLLMNDLNRSQAEVISTYVYKIGLVQHDFSYSTSVNLFNSIINLALLLTVNWVVKRLNQTSLY